MNVASQLSIAKVITLGIAQIIVWGGTFFIMAVLANPIAKETGWSSQWIYGALSMAIFISGLLAPYLGKKVTQFGGKKQLLLSGFIMALGLAVMGCSYSLLTLYSAWLIIGIGMALGLYETLFATIGLVFGKAAKSQISQITLISGFASTLSWPLVAWISEEIGWRGTCFVYAALIALTTLPMYLWALPDDTPYATTTTLTIQSGTLTFDRLLYLLLGCSFTLAAAIMTIFSVQIIVLLQGLGYSLTAAVAIAALMGPSIVASRVIYVFLLAKAHPIWSALASAALVAIGMLCLLLQPALASAAIILYGLGNGLRAIARATLPLQLISTQQYPVLMGQLARPALIGQALMPLLGGYLFERFGAASSLLFFCVLAVINVGLLLATYWRIESTRVL